jgi:hypothetical protein
MDTGQQLTYNPKEILRAMRDALSVEKLHQAVNDYDKACFWEGACPYIRGIDKRLAGEAQDLWYGVENKDLQSIVSTELRNLILTQRRPIEIISDADVIKASRLYQYIFGFKEGDKVTLKTWQPHAITRKVVSYKGGFVFTDSAKPLESLRVGLDVGGTILALGLRDISPTTESAEKAYVYVDYNYALIPAKPVQTEMPQLRPVKPRK